MYEWLLVLHVLSAFALVAGVVAFWAVTIATRGGPNEAIGSISRPFAAIIAAGSMLALVFGVWLALYLDEYEIWDFWILGSIVLWLVAGGAGGQTGKAMAKAAEGGPNAGAHRRRGVALHVVSSAAVLLILVLMIFKPGA